MKVHRQNWPLRVVLPLLYFSVLYGVARILKLQPIDVSAAIQDMREYLGRYQNPYFGALPKILIQMGITILIGAVGTTIAFLLGLLVLPCALRVLEFHSAIRGLAVIAFTFLRAVPDAVFAVLLLIVIGVGPQCGAIAIALHCCGFVGKSLSDTIDRLPIETVRGVEASGARRMQIFCFGLIPTVIPELANLFLYTFDRNVRMAAVLGVIGAGGIGLTIKTEMDSFHYPEAAAALAVLVVSILILESGSNRVRKFLTLNN